MDDVSERKLLTEMLSAKSVSFTPASGVTTGAAHLAYRFGPIVFVSLNYNSTVTTTGSVLFTGLPKPLFYGSDSYGLAIAVTATNGTQERLTLRPNGDIALDGEGVATYVNGSFCYIAKE